MVLFLQHEVPSTLIVFVPAENSDASTAAEHFLTTSTTDDMFTDKDIAASNRFADSNVKIRTIRLIYSKAPHLASKLKYTVHDAQPHDYYIPRGLEHACKVVEVEITKDLCHALSCNPTTDKGVCIEGAHASYYRVGDDGYDVQCQPACFYSADKRTYNQDGSRIPDTAMLNYHNGKCRIVPATMVSYLEKPFFRSTVLYERRVNDMPTGFSRTLSSNPYGCGLDYKTNETYCKYYDRKLEEDGSCSLEWWEKGLDAIVGMSLVNTVKSSLRVVINHETPFNLPSGLPDLPSTLETKHTLDGWKNDVNRSFVVPNIVDIKPIKVDDIIHDHGLNLRNDLGQLPSLLTDVRLELESTVTSTKVKSKHEQCASAVDNKNEASENLWIETMKTAMIGMLEHVTTDRSFWINMGVGLVTDAMLASLKSTCKKLIESMSLSLVQQMPNIIKSVNLKVLQASLKSTCLKIVTGKAARIASKTAITLAKITSAAVSVVGWLFLAASLLDILFTLWDPYGYNEMFPATLPHDLMSQGERAFRQAAETASLNYEFEHFAALTLSEEEMLSIQVESLEDRLVYLNSLTVNSDGTRIEKGEIIYFNGNREQSMLYEAHNRAMVNRVHFDADAYAEYNRDFLTRVRVNKMINQGANTSVMMAAGLMILGLHLLSALFLIIALVGFAIARTQVYDSTIVNFIKTL